MVRNTSFCVVAFAIRTDPVRNPNRPRPQSNQIPSAIRSGSVRCTMTFTEPLHYVLLVFVRFRVAIFVVNINQ